MPPRSAWSLLLLILLLPFAIASGTPPNLSTLSHHPLQLTNPSAAPTSFCKCTCYNTNSTIIPLDSPPSSASPNPSGLPSQPHRSCADCNKQFCLSYHLPICQDATESDVFATCFQRDSKKDQAVVFVFLSATGGLLVWAAVGPWVRKWRGRRGYGVVGEGEGDG